MLIAGLIIASFTATAQEEDPVLPAWVSDKGYWVVESNRNVADSCTVYFYNNDLQLVYRETIRNAKLDISKRRVRMLLKKVLEKSVKSYARQQRIEENRDLLAAVLKK